MSRTNYSNAEEELSQDIDKFESDMNTMLRELTEMENIVKNGVDLKEMQSLVDVTKEYMGEHMKNMDTLKTSIIQID